MIQKIQQKLSCLADEKRADHSRLFFKTGPGQYGQGDIFRGIRVPVLRKLAAEYRTLSIVEAAELLSSSFHEDRLLALIILIRLFARGNNETRQLIYSLYLDNTQYVNNWDLVDSSAEYIVGAFLYDKNTSILYRLARSKSMWVRRIAIMSTFHFIKQGRFDDTLKIAKLLINDPEDLIHKAVGWMLREIGKRDIDAEEAFLKNHYKNMPRTMLRYAIEKFPEQKRQAFLKGTI